MSILTWNLKRGDFVNVYSPLDQCNRRVKIKSGPFETYEGLHILYGEYDSATFDEKKQQWEEWYYKGLN